jgi:hypothetical protein
MFDVENVLDIHDTLSVNRWRATGSPSLAFDPDTGCTARLFAARSSPPDPGGAAVVEQNIIGKGRVLITVDNAIEKRPGGRPALEYAKGLATMLSVHYGVLRHMPKTFTPGHQ